MNLLVIVFGEEGAFTFAFALAFAPALALALQVCPYLAHGLALVLSPPAFSLLVCPEDLLFGLGRSHALALVVRVGRVTEARDGVTVSPIGLILCNWEGLLLETAGWRRAATCTHTRSLSA